MSSEPLLIKLLIKVLSISKTIIASCEFGISTLSKEYTQFETSFILECRNLLVLLKNPLSPKLPLKPYNKT